jgi:tetratricopeptide (TPR) repeat protein
MHLQAELGDRAGAISTFHQCAATLERELGVDPSGETTQALEALLGDGRHMDVRRAEPPTRGRLGTATASTFVGRDQELAEVSDRWRRAVEGEPGLLVVSGDPGVGKSRLAAELAATARAEGALVAATRCFGMARRLALAPVADWLRNPGFGRAVRSLAPVWRAEVARLVPGVAAGSHDVPLDADRPSGPGTDTDTHGSPASRAMVDAWRRHRFYEGLARAILAVDRPALLLLDDLQWCDEETAAWLSFMLRLAEDAPLLVVTTVRGDELDDNAEVSRLLRSLATSGAATEIGLPPLSRADVRELGGSLLERELSDDEAALLSNATGGYPLYVVEAIRDAGPNAVRADHLTVSADLAGVLRHRLEAASAEAREVAGLAAAYGREFSLDLLTEASDLDAETVVRAVDELWRRRIIREQGTDYDFSHDLVRESAYESVSPPRRWLLHRRLAQGLELLYAGREHEVAAQLAGQYERGGRSERARRYYRIAADLAASLFANSEAIRLFNKCNDLAAALPEGRARDQEELGILVAMTAPMTAVYGYSSPKLQKTLERCEAVAERLGRRADLMASRTGLFAVRFVQGRIRDAYNFALSALELAGAEPALAGQAHLAVAGSSTSLGRLVEASRHFDLARDLSRGCVSLIVGSLPEVHSLAWHSHAHWLLGNEASAVASYREAIAIARAEDHPYSLALALGYQATTDQLRGQLDRAAGAAAELIEVCERYEFAWYVEWGHIVEAWITGGQPGIDGINSALRRLRTQGSYARMPYWLGLLAELHLREGDRDSARGVLDAARSTAEQNDELWWLPETIRAQASLHEPEVAIPMLVRAADLAREQQSVMLLARCERDLARLGAVDAPHSPAG